MKIIIGADFVPTGSNLTDFEKGNAEKLFGYEISDLLEGADFRVFNLETPLTDSLFPINKCGPNLSAPTKCIRGYLAAKADLLTLANNHIMDQDDRGLFSTIEILQENGIAYTGAGRNINEARKPFIIETSGEKIGVYACAEHEFSIADETHPGANPYDPLESFDDVAELSRSCGFTIVLYHGGKENYRYPTPMLRKCCRKFIEKGADLVVCQHSHCIGCEEKYLTGTIVYGQGNFLFDYSDMETWKTGLLIAVNGKDISYIPICKTGSSVKKADETEAGMILDAFYERSAEIQKPGFIEEQAKILAERNLIDYLEMLSGKRNEFFYRVMKKITKGKFKQFYFTHYYNLASRLRTRNYIECETHRELVIQSLKNGS